MTLCVIMVLPNFRYKSTEACQDHEVFWESTVVGKVTSKKIDLPVGNVTVEWEIKTTSMKGVVVTAADGRFEVRVCACARAYEWCC